MRNPGTVPQSALALYHRTLSLSTPQGALPGSAPLATWWLYFGGAVLTSVLAPADSTAKAVRAKASTDSKRAPFYSPEGGSQRICDLAPFASVKGPYVNGVPYASR